MSALLLVFFLNGYSHYEVVPNVESCIERGNDLVNLGFISHYQCASVLALKGN